MAADARTADYALSPEEARFSAEVSDEVLMRADAASIHPVLLCLMLGRLIGLVLGAGGVIPPDAERTVLGNVIAEARRMAREARAAAPMVAGALSSEEGHA